MGNVSKIMSRKYDIIAAARAIVRTNTGYRAPILIHPQRDWWLGIGLFTLVVLIGGGILARTYTLNDSLDTLVGAEADTVPRYQAEVVGDVLEIYRVRASGYQSFVDNQPELPLIATTTDEGITETTETDLEEVEPEPAVVDELESQRE
jgi:hypothetical protein